MPRCPGAWERGGALQADAGHPQRQSGPGPGRQVCVRQGPVQEYRSGGKTEPNPPTARRSVDSTSYKIPPRFGFPGCSIHEPLGQTGGQEEKEFWLASRTAQGGQNAVESGILYQPYAVGW